MQVFKKGSIIREGLAHSVFLVCNMWEVEKTIIYGGLKSYVCNTYTRGRL